MNPLRRRHPHSHASLGRRAARFAVTQASKTDRRFFFRIVEQLKVRLPLRRPVVVLVGRQFSKVDGDCSVVGGRFRIRVSRELNESQAIDVLLHEWAHALSWDVCVGKAAKSRSISNHEFERLAHGPKWGLAYSKVYLCFTGEILLHLRAEDLNAEMFTRTGSRR